MLLSCPQCFFRFFPKLVRQTVCLLLCSFNCVMKPFAYSSRSVSSLPSRTAPSPSCRSKSMKVHRPFLSPLTPLNAVLPLPLNASPSRYASPPLTTHRFLFNSHDCLCDMSVCFLTKTSSVPGIGLFQMSDERVQAVIYFILSFPSCFSSSSPSVFSLRHNVRLCQANAEDRQSADTKSHTFIHTSTDR